MPSSGEREELAADVADTIENLNLIVEGFMRDNHPDDAAAVQGAIAMIRELSAGYRRAAAPSTDAAVANGGWRPISEAPRDALVLVGAVGMPHVWWASFKYVGPRAGTRWETVGLGALTFEPTHWQPLPEPPQ